MTRHPDWERRLARALADHAAREAGWGRSDCWTVACDVHRAVTGKALLPYLRRYSSETGGYRLFRKHGFETVEDALASALERRPVLTAQRGDIGTIERNGVVACCIFTALGAQVRSAPGSPGPWDYYPVTAARAAFRVG